MIAAGIHELIPLLVKSQNTVKAITKEYIGLLKDKHPEVRPHVNHQPEKSDHCMYMYNCAVHWPSFFFPGADVPQC